MLAMEDVTMWKRRLKGEGAGALTRMMIRKMIKLTTIVIAVKEKSTIR